MAQDAMHPHRTTNKTCYTATRGEFEDMLNKWIADKDLLSSGLAYEICKVPATATMTCPQVKHPRKAIRLHIIKVMGCTQANWRVYDRWTCQAQEHATRMNTRPSNHTRQPVLGKNRTTFQNSVSKYLGIAQVKELEANAQYMVDRTISSS